MNFQFIGWCKEGNHDKIWVALEYEGKFYAAWGRREKKLQFKEHTTKWILQHLAQKKQRSGYQEVDEFQLFALFPDFENVVTEQLFMKTLSGGVK